jgi:hypothetical protein
MEEGVNIVAPPYAFARLRMQKSLATHQSFLLQDSGDLFLQRVTMFSLFAIQAILYHAKQTQARASVAVQSGKHHILDYRYLLSRALMLAQR